MNTEKQNSHILAALWNLFASVKLTVVFLILLAVTSVIGTLIPQNENIDAYVQAYGEPLYRLFHVLDIFNMYHSWWFQSLIGLLVANIAVCSLKRLPAVWKIAFGRAPGFNLARFKRLPEPEVFTDVRNPKELEPLYQNYVKRRFSRWRIEQTNHGIFITADKGGWTRFGVYFVHLSVILLLAGALIGSFFGFDGYVNIAEGETVDRIRLRNVQKTLPLGFEIRCDDFDVSFYKSGAPKEYRSKLTIIEQDREVLQKDIIVNDPLRYKGINLFQSSYGSIAPKDVLLSFTNRASGKVYRQKASIGQTIDLPESTGTLVVKQNTGDYKIKGFQVGETFIGTLQPKQGNPIEVVLPQQFPTFDKMRKGTWIISVAKHKHQYYTGLQVTKDPGVPVVYAGFVLMIIGCFVAFFMSHKKFGVEVSASGNSSKVRVVGTANKNNFGMSRQVQTIARALADLK